MIHKKAILLIGLLLIPLAYAVIITQEQLDSIDPLTYDLMCQAETGKIWDNNYFYPPTGKRYVVRTISCRDLVPYNETHYNVFRGDFYVFQSHDEFRYCLLINNWEFCEYVLWENLKSQVLVKKLEIRKRIIYYQTDNETEFYGNFTF